MNRGQNGKKDVRLFLRPGKPEKANNLIINSLWIVFYVEWHQLISIAHYGEQSGDLMADPEMEFTIIGGDYYPISFRNDYLAKHNSIFEDDGINLPLQHDLTTFANQWMRNIAEQQKLYVN